MTPHAQLLGVCAGVCMFVCVDVFACVSVCVSSAKDKKALVMQHARATS